MTAEQRVDEPRSENHGIPARLVLGQAQALNHALGHENLGCLSEAYGFMPCSPPLPKLPPAFKAWDALASRLPELHCTLRLRSELDALEVLDAGREHLPDSYLLRASTLLSILAHAYYYVETKPPISFPDCIRIPWEQVSRRLGRPQPGLSYIDLIVYNWQLLDPLRHDPMRLDNLQLLIPTVDNEEERIFYLTQTEILAQCTPIVGAVVRAQEAVKCDDSTSLKLELLTITKTLQRVTRESLPQIDPRGNSQTFMNPVVWAKAVAPFAVPFTPKLQGPSGTSSPIFNLLDVFFGRQRFDSLLGKEIMQLRQLYPKHWQDFLLAVAQVSVADYISQTGDKELGEVFQEVLEAYAGERGFLGRHRLKVYGYLQLAFKVGRSVTIGGFSGVFKERTWNQVDEELEAARRERFPRVQPAPPEHQAERGEPCYYDVSEIVAHNGAEAGHWLVLDGQVYNLTSYLNRHPGGAHVLRSYAGVDASKTFRRIHGSQAAITNRLNSLYIGTVRPLVFTAMGGAETYRLWVNVLYLLVEIENALELEHDLSLQRAQTIRDEDGSIWSPYKLQQALETHERFTGNVVAGVLGEAVTDLWTATCQLCSMTRATPDVVDFLASLRSSAKAWQLEQHLGAMEAIIARFADGSLPIASPIGRRLAEACERLAAEDQRLVKEVKNVLRAGVMVFERNDEPNQLLAAASGLPEALASYYDRLLQELEVLNLSADPTVGDGLSINKAGDAAKVSLASQ